MKIEIELGEVERLRQQIIDLTNQKDLAEKKLYEARIDEMEKKAISLSEKLFGKYMQIVFKGLGFKDTGRNPVDINFGYNNKKKWWDQDDITVEVSANISESFRSAFINIGCLNKGWPKEESLFESEIL